MAYPSTLFKNTQRKAIRFPFADTSYRQSRPQRPINSYNSRFRIVPHMVPKTERLIKSRTDVCLRKSVSAPRVDLIEIVRQNPKNRTATERQGMLGNLKRGIFTKSGCSRAKRTPKDGKGRRQNTEEEDKNSRVERQQMYTTGGRTKGLSPVVAFVVYVFFCFVVFVFSS